MYFQERLKLSPLLGAVVLHCRWKCIRCNKELQPNVSSFCAQDSNFKENRNEELVFPIAQIDKDLVPRLEIKGMKQALEAGG